MTAVQIPWAPGAKYIHVTCRIGEPRPDGDDPDPHPDLMPQSGEVVLRCNATRIRYTETDGRRRMLSMREWKFSIRASDGELYSPSTGEIGVWVLSGLTAGMDPAGFTWVADVIPESGDRWSATIPSIEGDFDLTDGADIVAPSPGESTIAGRVTAVESVLDVSGTDAGDVLTADGAGGTAWQPPVGGGGGAVSSVNGETGAVTLDAADVGAAAEDHSHTLDQTTDTATRVAMTQAERTKLAGVADGAEVNVNADWNAASGDAQILNKPTIPTPPPDASTTVKGIVELATTAETTTGTDTVRAVTPAGLKAVADTKQAAGSYAPASHTHDDRYYTETETDNLLAGKASSTHNHDGAYAPASHNHDSAYATTAQGAKADTALQVATPQPINAQTGTTYTPVLTDAGKLVTCTNAAPIVVTLPRDSALAFPIGGSFDVSPLGVGMVTFAAGAAVFLRVADTAVTRKTYSVVTCIKLAADTWLVAGDLV